MSIHSKDIMLNFRHFVPKNSDKNRRALTLQFRASWINTEHYYSVTFIISYIHIYL